MSKHGARTLRLRGGADGIELVGDEWGDEGEIVVFMHGGGQTRHAWGSTAATIAAQGFRTISIDMRGHGDSSWSPDGDYSIDRFVDDLRALRADLDRAPSLVGASLGGMTGLLAVGEGDDDFARSLVLVDVTPTLNPKGADRIRQFMTAFPDGFESLDAAAEHVATYVPHRSRPRDTSGLRKNLRQGSDGRFRWHWDPRFLDSVATRSPVNQARLRRAAANLSVRTLLVRGRMSDIVTPEAVKEFRTLAPRADFVDVSGAGHMVAGDRNDSFTRAVAQFLSRLPETSSD